MHSVCMKFSHIGIFFVDLKAIFNASLFKVTPPVCSVSHVNYFVFPFLVFSAECNKLTILGILPYCIFPAVILILNFRILLNFVVF